MNFIYSVNLQKKFTLKKQLVYINLTLDGFIPVN